MHSSRNEDTFSHPSRRYPNKKTVQLLIIHKFGMRGGKEIQNSSAKSGRVHQMDRIMIARTTRGGQLMIGETAIESQTCKYDSLSTNWTANK